MPRVITDIEAAHEALRDELARAERVVGFTGAGISTECGVPDFRSPGSPWTRYLPIDFQTFLSSPAMRAEAWRRKFAMDDLYAGAQPGRGHKALARLVAAGRMTLVVTQNIDGLHQASGLGNDAIVELHGNGTYATCLSCDARHELMDVRLAFEATGQAPECACGGIVKSATVAFGQKMPSAALRRAQEAMLACDLVLTIGSSLVVRPAATLPVMARQNGARLAIVNREPTALDPIADLLIRADIGDVLEPAVRLCCDALDA